MIRTPPSGLFQRSFPIALLACAGSFATPPTTSDRLCWDKVALPILKRNCLGCHGNGSAMGNLSDYDSAKARAEKIRVQLASGKMPMRGELPEANRATLLAWTSQGANSCP